MRISFLCPRLPPTTCGVGDHTKFLAQAMAEEGARVAFIHCQAGVCASDIPPGPVSHWTGSSAALVQCVREQSPNWLWVQVSGYGYSRWGAPFRLGCALARLRQKLPRVRLAIYLHETHCRPWQLGIKAVLSPWQKHTVGRIARLGDVVFTSNERWRGSVLQDYHVESNKAVLLPIGSNIPSAALGPPGRRRLRRKLNWADEEIVAVTFGSYGPQLRALGRFRELLLNGLSQNLLHRVVCLGGDQLGIPRQFETWRMCFGSPGAFQVLGPRPAHEVGEILECCDFAFTATPRSLLEKSGAFIAFAMAGLAVLVFGGSRDDVNAFERLPVLAAESWDWRVARSPHVAGLRMALRQHAECHYRWATIARRALDRMVCLMSLVPDYDATTVTSETRS